MKPAVIYFSRAGQNWVNGKVVNLKYGNTEKVAAYMAHHLSCPLFRIAPKVSYSSQYELCTEQAKKDQEDKVYPELFSYPDLKNFDTIYLGYPIYWETCPMAVFSFARHYDFQGKRVFLFSTHEGSGMGSSLHDLETMGKNLKVMDSLPIPGSLVDSYSDRIKEFLAKTKD